MFQVSAFIPKSNVLKAYAERKIKCNSSDDGALRKGRHFFYSINRQLKKK